MTTYCSHCGQPFVGGHVCTASNLFPPPQLQWSYPAQPPITLRDWFAGQALVGMLARSSSGDPQSEYAYQAFQMADAMLAQREKQP